MLVLSREIGQKIVIGGGITIKVVGIAAGGKVLLGVTAPAHIPIHREEIQKLVDAGKLTESQESS